MKKLRYADADFSDEFLQILNANKKKYRVGTVVVCADGIQVRRVRGGFESLKGLPYLVENSGSMYRGISTK